MGLLSIVAVLLDISGNYELAEDGMTPKVIHLGKTSRIISVALYLYCRSGFILGIQPRGELLAVGSA